MFAKLLKYEWKANAGLLTILSACALGVGALGAGVIRMMAYLEKNIMEEELAAAAISTLSSIMFFVVIALVAYALAVQFITLWRFYKNKFTDEGYLTFTLPVNSRQLFLSSFLNILAWLAISVFVLICAVAMMVFIGVGEPLKEIFQTIGKIASSMDAFYNDIELQGANLFYGLSMLQIIVSPVYAIVLLMTSITLGCVLAKKHKIFATIGMYYAINMVVNVVTPVLSIVPTVSLIVGGMNSDQDLMYHMSASIGTSLLLQVGLAIGGYFWSTYLMKHKLNLP